jgi:hypothetical protein
MKLFACCITILVLFTIPGHSQVTDSNGCLSLIINIRDWKETPSVKWDYDKNGTADAALLYLGAEHLDDAHHPQFEKIKNKFENFKPTIVFYEGLNRGIAETDTSTIRQFGESGYARWLAHKSNIPSMSLEPTFADIYQYLLSKYSHEQVDLYMFTKEASRLHYRKKMNKEQVTDAITQMMDKVGQMTGSNRPLLTNIKMIDSVYRKYFSTGEEWWQVPQDWFDPAGAGKGFHFTNELSELSSSFRNIFMVQLLANQVNSGKRVFGVIGRNHVPLQAPALDCAIR